MKRRGFLGLVGGLVAAPFVPTLPAPMAPTTSKDYLTIDEARTLFIKIDCDTSALSRAVERAMMDTLRLRSARL